MAAAIPSTLRLIAALLAATSIGLGAASAAETTVYRCGPQGNQYSQQPCPSGTAVDVSDGRSPAQVDEARRVSLAEQKLANELSRERRARERDARPAQAGGIGFRSASAADGPAAREATHPKKKKAAGSHPASSRSAASGKPKEFVAIGPGTAKPKRRKAQA